MEQESNLTQEQIDAAEIAVQQLFEAYEIFDDSLLLLHRQHMEEAGPVKLLELIEAIARAIQSS